MSSAHRPTWDPAQGKDTRGNSKIYSSRDLAAHTRLKFRQPGQGSTSDIARRDLKAELLAAERESAARKAKGQAGYVPDKTLLMLENQAAQAELDGAESKRRKMLEAVGGLDADDDDDDDDEDDEEEETSRDKGKGKAVESEVASANGADDDDDDDDDDSDDDEDETAELLRELEKIKKERAEEKEKQERERLESEQTNREEEIAMGK
ncbi:Pre-mRNA-splicing factor Cwf15/Cwc15 [Leucosporidium creatinivorum]|uniref:Pre-mRNA-splicing factor Cwf15/Cwc15 n=1 Tax=Leucosporidium creatinivorum TaxID=106004 RepID=A0A1Y2FBP3_9BASI|nr:Pre-mRNA-splicing factor Cwf15/Cwc15 [Leucosporidium creatinivorum]